MCKKLNFQYNITFRVSKVDGILTLTTDFSTWIGEEFFKPKVKLNLEFCEIKVEIYKTKKRDMNSILTEALKIALKSLNENEFKKLRCELMQVKFFDLNGKEQSQEEKMSYINFKVKIARMLPDMLKDALINGL